MAKAKPKKEARAELTKLDTIGLTTKQLQMIEVLADPTDTRVKAEKCKEADISRQTLWNWMQKPEFMEALNRRVSELITTARPLALHRLAYEAQHADYARDRIAAARSLLMATGDIGGGGTRVQTNVVCNQPPNPFEGMSDEELMKMDREDTEMIIKLEALEGKTDTVRMLREVLEAAEKDEPQ